MKQPVMWKYSRFWGIVVAALAVNPLLSSASGQSANTEFTVPLGQRQLFLDDCGVASIDGLTRTMHPPVKRGAVIRPTPPEETSVQTRSAPAWDPEQKVYKLWLLVSRTGGSSGTGYVESTDGLHWTKPVLRQKEIDGSLENNIVTPDPAREWPANAIENAVYDPHDPDPSRRYKGFAHCYDREPMVSPDGIHWTLLNVPALKSSDESNLSYDAQTHTFLATLKTGGPHGRSHVLTTSKDFEDWTEPVLTFHADDLDQELGRENIKARFANPAMQQPSHNIPETYNVDIYNVGVFRYEGLYIALPSMFHQTGKVGKDWPGFDDPRIPEEMRKAYRESGDWSGFHDVQLMCSRDLKTWQRLGNRKPFIGSSPLGAGAYDLACVLPPSFPIVRGDELWFYYTGGMNYGLVVDRGVNASVFAICLAVLRRDGFISLDAGDTEGTLLTQPFTMPGGELYMNADAFTGAIRAEVLDEAGTVLAASIPMQGDLLNGQAKWENAGIAELKGQTVRLRFTLKNTAFYSYWFGE
ncbi:MAG: hypothetical protein IT364_03520 [Candidatus Hydrogenedentes bacterium]|nr:hypothetical protein [Candidatus Hydrogenedentota bacterium]